MNYMPQSWPITIEYWLADGTRQDDDEGTTATVIGWKMVGSEALPVVLLESGGAFPLSIDDSWRVRA